MRESGVTRRASSVGRDTPSGSRRAARLRRRAPKASAELASPTCTSKPAFWSEPTVLSARLVSRPSQAIVCRANSALRAPRIRGREDHRRKERGERSSLAAQLAAAADRAPFAAKLSATLWASLLSRAGARTAERHDVGRTCGLVGVHQAFSRSVESSASRCVCLIAV